MYRSSKFFSAFYLDSRKKSFILFIHYNPARHRPVIWPLSEPHTGTTRDETLQLLRSLSYSTGNAQGCLLCQAYLYQAGFSMCFKVFFCCECLTFPLHVIATDVTSILQAKQQWAHKFSDIVNMDVNMFT